MNVIAFNDEVSKDQLKQYADVICFSQVGLEIGEISDRLELPQHLVYAWVASWHDLEQRMSMQ